MITVAFVLLSLSALLLVYRLWVGPSIADRMVALDALLMVVVCGIFVEASRIDSIVGLDTALVVSVVGFIGTGIVARYIEGRHR